MHRPGRGRKQAVPIGTIEIQTGEQYQVGERLDSGASGVVYRAHHSSDKGAEVAVKFYLVPKQAQLFGTTAQAVWGVDDEQVYDNERLALMALKHPGIQQVIGWGTVTDAASKFSNEDEFEVPPTNKVGFLVSKYIDGNSITKWIVGLAEEAAAGTLPKRYEIRTRIIRALIGVVEALQYLHEAKQYQHSDIRPENVLIERASQQPVLIDFGYAQVFADELIRSTPNTRIRPFRFLNAPAELEREIHELLPPGTVEVRRETLREKLFPGLDLYQLGKLFKTLYDDDLFRALVTPLDYEFLQLITHELLEWKTAKTLKTSVLHQQLSKLVDGYWSGAAAPHAPQLAPGQPVRKIALANINFLAPNYVKNIIETKSFRRLQQLKQLSLLDFVYPSATQTRLDHSLAVYSTAVELVQGLTRSPRFTKLFDTTSVTELLICALLHDVNHFPFLHYFQELQLATTEPLNLFDFFIKTVGAENGRDGSQTVAEVVADAGVDPETIIALLTRRYREFSDPRHQVIKSVLDSGADIDKLCYVQGDARFTGVPFGVGVDRQTLLSSADILIQPRDRRVTDGSSRRSRALTRDSVRTAGEQWHLCFAPPALSAVESLLLARYWNFKRIYWHHTNRALGAMVSHVLRTLTEAGHLGLQDYIVATMSFTEAAAMAYLNNVHADKFGRASILHDLVTRRAGLFKRLLSIKAPWLPEAPRTEDEKRRHQLVELLRNLPDTSRSSVVAHFTEGLYTLFPSLRQIAPDDELLVLLDIPGRPLDEDMGEVFVTEVDLDGEAGHLVNSPFIATLKKEFLDLSRTVRLFVPASVRDRIGKDRIQDAQEDLEELLLESLLHPNAPQPGTVR